MSDFGFVGAAYEAASPTQDTQECINWYPEVDPTKNAGTKAMGVNGERGVTALYPCPGLTSPLVTLAAAAEVRGFHVLPGGSVLLSVCGNKLYSITTSYVATEVGTLLSSSGQVGITDNGTVAYVVDGSNRYAYTWGTGAFVTLADGGFNGATHCDITDNYIIYNRPSANSWGCTDVGSSGSSGLNVGSPLTDSSYVMAVKADHREAWIIKEKTTEVWTEAGTFPFPFQILPGTTMQHGCAAPYSVARLGESLAWVSKDTRGQAVVIHTVGYAPQRISTHAIENDIKGGVISDAIGFTYQQNGHEFYVLTFPTQDKTWVFDLATNLWHKRAWRDGSNVLHRHRANCCASFNGRIVVGDWQNGKIYEWSLSTYTDNGDTLPCIRRGPHITSDLKNQFFHRLQLQFQPGVGDVTTPNPQAMLRWSNDGGFTWNDGGWQSLGMGAAGEYTKRAIWTGLGMARDRVFEVEVTDPVYRVLVSANLDMSVGGN